MSGFLHASVLNHDRLETVIASHLAEKWAMLKSARALGEVFEESLVNNPDLGETLRADIIAHYDRDSGMPVISRPGFVLQRFSGIAGLIGRRIG